MYFDSGLVFLVEGHFFIVEIDPAMFEFSDNEGRYDERRCTYTTVRMILRSVIFLTVASQSSISMGFSPSVRIMTFRVHVFLFPR